MTFFDPFPTIEAAPGEPPFHYCRFNTAYLGFILGALQDSIDRADFWSGSIAEIGEMLEKVDHLYYVLMSEVPPVTNLQTAVIHPWSWQRHSGTWIRALLGVAPYWPYVHNTSNGEGDRISAPAYLPAGNYTVEMSGSLFPTGGRGFLVAGSSLSDQILATLAMYGNPQTYFDKQTHNFTLTDDYDGELSVIASHSGLMGTGGNGVVLPWLAFRNQDA